MGKQNLGQRRVQGHMVSNGLEMQTESPRQQAFVKNMKSSFSTQKILVLVENKGAGTSWTTCPPELCSVQLAALWGPAFKAYKASLAPTAKDNEHRYFMQNFYLKRVSLSR